MEKKRFRQRSEKFILNRTVRAGGFQVDLNYH